MGMIVNPDDNLLSNYRINLREYQPCNSCKKIVKILFVSAFTDKEAVKYAKSIGVCPECYLKTDKVIDL